jgi:probable F420-dependent oxidoreductase
VDGSTGFRFILGVSNAPLDELVPLARHAEVCGFDALSLTDHLALPAALASRYPYSTSGAPAFGLDEPWSDPWVAMGAMATATERLHFMTNVFVLPLRDPFTVAKAVGSVSVLSGGRVALGVGVGWMREEFDLVGARFADRGARTNEMIEVLRLLWRAEAVEHHGRFYDFAPVRMSPAPAQPVPILVGGESPAALDRAVRLGDGFISLPHRTKTLVALAETLRRRRAALGCADEAFEIVTPPTDATSTADFVALAAGGVTGVIQVPWSGCAGCAPGLDKRLDAMTRYARGVIAPAREAGLGHQGG